MVTIFPFLVCCIGAAMFVYSCKLSATTTGNKVTMSESAVRDATTTTKFTIKYLVSTFPSSSKTNVIVEWTLDQKLVTGDIQNFEIQVTSLKNNGGPITEYCPTANCRSHKIGEGLKFNGKYMARIVARKEDGSELAHTAMTVGFHVENEKLTDEGSRIKNSWISIFATPEALKVMWSMPERAHITQLVTIPPQKSFSITIKRADGTGKAFTSEHHGAEVKEAHKKPISLQASLLTGYHIMKVKSLHVKEHVLSAGFMVKEPINTMNEQQQA